MNIVEPLDAWLDLRLARKLFLWFSAAILLLIPADALCIHFKRAGYEGHPLSQAHLEFSRPAVEPLASYLTIFDKSTLFGAGTSTANAPVLKASLAELVKDYRLKGVIFMDTPEAIIEDARTRMTQFVKVGERLGDLVVKEIRESTMVLSYLGEEIKLEIQA